MDDLLELVLTLIDNLTGNKLDYGVGKLVRRLTGNIRNQTLRKVLQMLLWILFFVMAVAGLAGIVLMIEVLRNGKV